MSYFLLPGRKRAPELETLSAAAQPPQPLTASPMLPWENTHLSQLGAELAVLGFWGGRFRAEEIGYV